jgi:hypothetical protein
MHGLNRLVLGRPHAVLEASREIAVEELVER